MSDEKKKTQHNILDILVLKHILLNILLSVNTKKNVHVIILVLVLYPFPIKLNLNVKFHLLKFFLPFSDFKLQFIHQLVNASMMFCLICIVIFFILFVLINILPVSLCEFFLYKHFFLFH